MKSKENNPYANCSDEMLISLCMVYSRWTPVYEDCTEEEYNNADSLSRLLLEYKRIPIYDTGVMGIIHGAEPVKYQYKRKAGEKRVFLVGADLADELRKRGLTTSDMKFNPDKLTEYSKCSNVDTSVDYEVNVKNQDEGLRDD